MRLVTGIQPSGSGHPHLGNYLGVIRRIGQMAEPANSFCFVADVHATTRPFTPTVLDAASRATAASLLAASPDAVVFRQSAVPEQLALAVPLSHLAALGELSRMTQYSDRSAGEGERIGLGTLTYPVLMAADILAYQAEQVPVGADQVQHMDLVRVLVRRFNRLAGASLLRMPRAVLADDNAARIMSLRCPTAKMSKSGPPDGMVLVSDSLDTAAARFRSATTDSGRVPFDVDELVDRPAIANLVRLLAAMRAVPTQDVLSELGGLGYAPLKDALTEAFREHILPYGRRLMAMEASDELDRLLLRNALHAREACRDTVSDVYRGLGLAAPFPIPG